MNFIILIILSCIYLFFYTIVHLYYLFAYAFSSFNLMIVR